MGDNIRRQREKTTMGWEEGTYTPEPDKRSTRLRLIVYGIAGLFFCTLLTIAVAAYFYI